VYEVKIISQFGAAHQLRDFGGKCESLHGHNWKIEVYATGKELDQYGLLIDFGVLKKATQRVLEALDHRFLNELEYFEEVNPSSENIARFIYEALQREWNSPNAKISKVTAWESDTACATYLGP
jgi:6-pyruvoyltetrahydropterin/6-carboxytetrahydropterin synthase